MIRLAALLLTVLTGFSGLVYEVTWQKYLATLLGSHSEATAAVLAIFLGGLSVGYWLFGRVTRQVVMRAEAAGRSPRLLLLYGALEVSIGAYAIAFPWCFMAVQVLSYSIPHEAGGIGFAIDVLLAVLLIGPASILMGGTIPILTQGLARSLDDATRFHALIYAFNTAGAFAGALAAGFYLIPKLGLVNVMFSMGLINLVAGSTFMLLGVRGRAVVSLETDRAGDLEGEHVRGAGGFAKYAFVALLTGFALMAIQTTLIRIAGLSFGSSQFTFSMVVAVFVLCIALGSFAVSALNRIPTWVVVANQWLLGLFFLLLYPRLDAAPYQVYLLRALFRDTNAALVAYYSLGFVAVLAVIGLPVLLSGAALPLLFHHMRREIGHLGDLAGNLYSWNTVGSLLGALLGGYAFLFWFELHHVYRFAVAALLLAALILTVEVYTLRRAVWVPLVSLLAVVALLPAWSPRHLYAGLFRQRDPIPRIYEGLAVTKELYPKFLMDNIIHHEDGPITSVTVREWQHRGDERALSISTNGKSDGDTFLDYTTMGLVAVVSAMLADDPKNAFVIGWGTGVTVGELASFDAVERVDVAEISPSVMNSAPLFDFANRNASTNPKIHVIESDAYRALMRSDTTYDLVVSEPSNPWVAGVEMLFSKEFLEAAKSKMSDGGVYCQWFHEYETDDETIELVLRTYAQVFDHVAVWRAASADLMLFGSKSPGVLLDHYRLEVRASQPDYRAALRRSGVKSFAGLLAHEALPLGVVHAMDFQGAVHTLYHPILNDMAGRAFFRGERGRLPFTGFGAAAKIAARNSMARAYFDRFGGRLPEEQHVEYVRQRCMIWGSECHALRARWMAEDPSSPHLAELVEDVFSRLREARSPDEISRLDRLYAAHDRRNDDDLTVAQSLQLTDDFVRFYNHAMPFDARALLDVWASCRGGSRSRAECTARAEKQIERMSRGASDDSPHLEALIDQCLAVRTIGPRCQAGSEQARALLETGQPGELLESWRLRRAQGT